MENQPFRDPVRGRISAIFREHERTYGVVPNREELIDLLSESVVKINIGDTASVYRDPKLLRKK
jgi:hypothetical protein